MKKIILPLAVAFILISTSTKTNAYYLDIVPNSSLDVTGVNSITFNVVFNPQGTINLGTYSFILLYDTSELTWNSGGTTNSPPSPLLELLGPPVENSSGEIKNFNGASFTGNAIISSPTILATVAFNVAAGVNIPTGDTLQDVWFNVSAPGSTFTINDQEVDIDQISLNSSLTDVSVVPEPVSSTLFLVGGATLGYRQFRKKRIKA